MSTKQSCRTCRHCDAGKASSVSFCKLRRIGLHSDVALFAFCHHWTKRQVSLPAIQEQYLDSLTDKQLDFERAVAGVEY